MKEVEGFFSAKSFAVIGASRDENKPGNIIFKNLIQNKSLKVYPINPKAKTLLGQKCYEDILEIPFEIDCAIVASPSKTTPLVLRQISKKKIKNVIMISAGFSESGEVELEEKIKNISKELDLCVLGPNCFGIVNPLRSINATFYSGETIPGEIAFISQSGAIASTILDRQEKLSGFVSIGNQTCLDFSDFIEYFSKDERTKVICIYMESIKEGRGKRFMEVCKKSKKPILILKSGTSKKGEEAAKSHTAAIATDKKIYSSVFKQLKLIEVDSIEKMFKITDLLKNTNYEKIENKTGIITNAGGFGVISADLAEKNKINLPSMKESTKKELLTFLPSQTSLKNPIDILGDATPERYTNTIQTIVKTKEFSSLVVILTPQKESKPDWTAKGILSLKNENALILPCFLGKTSIEKADQQLAKKFVIFDNLEELFYCLGKISK